MTKIVQNFAPSRTVSSSSSLDEVAGRVEVLSRDQLLQCPHWQKAFAGQRKDHRYYEIVEDTLHGEFDYRYFVIRDIWGQVIAVQPFFIHDQDLLQGSSPRIRAICERLREVWPRLLKMRTLMVGCVAGEGHLDHSDEKARCIHARMLARAVQDHADALGAPMIVMKEFPADYREALQCFRDRGFTRIPSFPMTRLNIDYANFEEFMSQAINGKMRSSLRRKFRDAAAGDPIELSVVTDIAPLIDEVYPLYLDVYDRSDFHFEKLTKEFFVETGRAMPDKVRYFVWRQSGRVIAFSLCMIQGDEIYGEYLGLDYKVALDRHLYFYAFRDVVTWGMQNGCKWFCSSGLNYEPKLQFRSELYPLDIYVRHTNRVLNAALKWLLPLLEPTQHDKTLPRFPDYAKLWQ
jgi:hypothetical protein